MTIRVVVALGVSAVLMATTEGCEGCGGGSRQGADGGVGGHGGIGGSSASAGRGGAAGGTSGAAGSAAGTGGGAAGAAGSAAGTGGGAAGAAGSVAGAGGAAGAAGSTAGAGGSGGGGPACIASDAGTTDAATDAAADGGCLVAINLFSTGVDATGVALAGGSVDPHYKLIQSADTTFTGPDAIVVSQIADGYWVAQSTTSKWIAPSANQQYPGATPCNNAGTYAYRTTFSLAGLDPATARIAGQWGADNMGTDVRLNGASLGLTAGGYAPLTPFEITSGFVAGTNTLEFEMVDLGCPNGLRVEMAGTAVAR